MKLTNLISIMAITFATPAFAADAITIGEYVQLKKSLAKDNTLIVYLSGAADALHAANTVLSVTNRPLLYCGLQRPLSATEAIKEIDGLVAQQIKRGNAPPEGMAITTVLANAVSVNHPCK